MPTFAADEDWLRLDDDASTTATPVAGADAILIEHALTPEECERLIAKRRRASASSTRARTRTPLYRCVHEHSKRRRARAIKTSTSRSGHVALRPPPEPALAVLQIRGRRQAGVRPTWTRVSLLQGSTATPS